MSRTALFGWSSIRRMALSMCVALYVLSTFQRAESSSSLSVRPIPTRLAYLVAIGVGDYVDSSLRLSYSEVDARSVASALTNTTSGLVMRDKARLVVGRLATRDRVLTDLDAARRWAIANTTLGGPPPTIIFYYSGHSRYEEKADELYLFPADVRSPDYEERLPLAGRLMPALAAPGAEIIFVADGCNIGDGLSSKLSARYPNVSVISASKEDESAYEMSELGAGLFTRLFVEALQSPATDLDKDGFISVEEAHHYVYGRVSADWSVRQHPSVSGRMRHRMVLGKTPVDSLILDSENTDAAILSVLSSVQSVQLNGAEVQVRATAGPAGPVQLLGNFSGMVQKGINHLRTARDEYIFWLEGKELVYYKNPYKTSYAIIAAIDDYERKRDPLKRGPTGYAHRDAMVKRGEELRATLENLGFARQRIVTLYNENATAAAIEDVLRSFWPGGSRADADRVFVYFGGHGDAVERSSRAPTGATSSDTSTQLTGYLVTYDFDNSRPTLSSLLMRDLTGRHAENVAAHHMLVAIDACHSGLALYKTLGDKSARDLTEFSTLSVIRSDTDSPARNVLVAGRENQKALWDDGGIFTKALIAGLSGVADFNRDGLVQFTELATHVKNEVARRAAEKGVKQQAMDYRLDAFGEGSVLFLTKQSAANPGVAGPPRRQRGAGAAR
jgi:uncharacterized caspase-like protein